MKKKLYEVLICLLIRRYIKNGYCTHPSFVAVDKYFKYGYYLHRCWLYNALKHII